MLMDASTVCVSAELWWAHMLDRPHACLAISRQRRQSKAVGEHHDGRGPWPFLAVSPSEIIPVETVPLQIPPLHCMGCLGGCSGI